MVLLFVSNAVFHDFLHVFGTEIDEKGPPPDFSRLGNDSKSLDMGELKYGFQTCLRLPRHVW